MKKNIIKYIIIFLIFSAAELFPDTIILNTKEEKSGTIIAEDQKQIILKTESGDITIPKTDISSIEIGIKGIPACIVFAKKAKEKNCQYNVINLSEKKVYLISEKKQNKPESFYINNIKTIELKKKSKDQKLIPYLKKNMPVMITFSNQAREEGIVNEIKNGEIEITKKDKTTASYFEIAISSITYINPSPKKPMAIPYRAIIPGWQQFHNQHKIKGSVFLVAFLGIGGGMINEFGQAYVMRNKAENQYKYLQLDANRTIMYHNPDYSSYHQHRANYYALGGAMALLYLVNFYDVYRTSTHSVSLSFNEGRVLNNQEYSYLIKFNFYF